MSLETDGNLVVNPGFVGRGVEPDGWSYHSPRTELELGRGLGSFADDSRFLTLSATGDVRSIGCWRGTAEIKPGKWYRASVRVRLRDIDSPTLSVFAHVARHYLAPVGPWQDETVLQQLIRSNRDHAYQGNRFEVYLRAAAEGDVQISEPRVVEVPAPSFRIARVATVRFSSETQGLTLAQQRERLAEHLETAGALGADVVATTEFTPVIGVPKDAYGSIADVAENVPDGPVCRVAAAAAAKHGMYVVVGNIERRGKHVFNTAVLFGRDGKLVGQYDKTHLTFGELEEGVSCGNSYPVFNLDFGRIGMHICYDEWFPEVARYYAHQGVEILFLCVAGGKPITWRTRALDNGIYFVAAATTPPSMIIESSGEIVAETHREGVVYADLNLDYRQTNWYRDPMLSYGMPCAVPQMRHVLDDRLLDGLHASLKTVNRAFGPRELG